jgi:hypothetical protein
MCDAAVLFARHIVVAFVVVFSSCSFVVVLFIGSRIRWFVSRVIAASVCHVKIRSKHAPQMTGVEGRFRSSRDLTTRLD